MSGLVDLLREGRDRERRQAAFYRSLSGAADLAGDGAGSERLNELLADEQHHVSRLSARLLELGEELDGAPLPPTPVPDLATWAEAARAREADEVAWYERALKRVDDGPTRTILAEILVSERHHHENLGGKWMPAGPPSDPDPEEGE